MEKPNNLSDFWFGGPPGIMVLGKRELTAVEKAFAKWEEEVGPKPRAERRRHLRMLRKERRWLDSGNVRR